MREIPMEEIAALSNATRLLNVQERTKAESLLMSPYLQAALNAPVRKLELCLPSEG